MINYKTHQYESPLIAVLPICTEDGILSDSVLIDGSLIDNMGDEDIYDDNNIF